MFIMNSQIPSAFVYVALLEVFRFPTAEIIS